MTIQRIIEIVCSDEDYQLPIECIQWNLRRREIVYPRQMCHYFAWEHTRNISLERIGEKIGNKDHSTVLHSMKTVINLMETDPQYKKRFLRISKRIKDEILRDRMPKLTMKSYQERKLIFAV